ncbi:hypothetical protein G6011_05967 [Alternaria panax]|uniref:Uncharacterized protein n=1 Tax=Alternaria panax TaxID=48097 RepID=A0AAD4FEL0_9PLEO|nr:hypothetical protein G6011_05967 [Alternaria panax]
MTKRPAETPLIPKATPEKLKATKKPKVAEKRADIEDAPPSANGQSMASNSPASAVEEGTTPTDDDEDTPLASEEVAPTPKKKKDAKVSTPKKASAKVTTPKKKKKKKKDAEAATIKSKATKASAPKIPKTKGSKPPVGDGFWPYQHSIAKPPFNRFWGDRPVTGSPRPHFDQPSARVSNGQTDPPLFENRGYRYKRGARYVKHHYTIDPTNMARLPRNRDQEDLLAVPLIDMRPNRRTLVPKQLPEVYCYGRKPKDWNCKQSIKALNDRRYQAIDRETMDGPWTEIEREYLAQLIREDPDASILDFTERHNDYFLGNDYKENVGFPVGGLSIGRTVESVRYQYTAYKPYYDRGDTPVVRWRGDKSAEGIALAKWIVQEENFGKPSKAEQLAHDKAHGGAEDSDDEDKSEAFDNAPGGKRHATEELEDDEPPVKYSKTGEGNPFAGQDTLNDDDEDLLALALNYDDNDATPQEDSDAEEIKEVTEYRDAETHVDADAHASREIEVDENYDD